VPQVHAPRYGIVRLDSRRRIIDLVEKPQTPAQLEALRLPPTWLAKQGLAADGREYLANMGIYLFNREVLFDLLHSQPLAKDLVTELFARRLSTLPLQAYLFDGYWADVGTIKAYHEASLSLCGDDPPFNFHSPEGVIYTRMRNLPASRVEAAEANGCMISDGCTVRPGAVLDRCVLGVRSTIGHNVRLKNAVIIGADEYETEVARGRNLRDGVPDIGVGDGSVIENAIVDKDCRIGRNVRIVNQGRVQEAEGDNYVIREGIVVIPNDAVVPDGTAI
jgi:glucose-1-phosphate adenylyltransferase